MEEKPVSAPSSDSTEQRQTDYAEAPASQDVAQETADEEIQLYPESQDASPYDVEHTTQPAGGGGGGDLPPSDGGGGDDDSDDEEMVKMSFLEHLEELRKRLIYSLIAVAAAFFLCFGFAQKIFDYMSVPVRSALREIRLPNGQPMNDALYFTKPTDPFTLLLNLSLIAGLFLASPVVLYQLWKFISPGLYKKERRYAVPFVFFCSSLFIAGGAFGYFIAFPYALKFLLTFGGERMVPWITATEYIDMFWTVILGLGIVFELPMMMMFLGLLGILSPRFLIRNFRYAVLVIFIVAAVVTPTSDVINLMIFAIPMMALYLLGIVLVWAVRRRRPELS